MNNHDDPRWCEWIDSLGLDDLETPITSTHHVHIEADILVPVRIAPWEDADTVLASVMDRIVQGSTDLLDPSDHPGAYVVAEDVEIEGIVGSAGHIVEVDR